MNCECCRTSISARLDGEPGGAGEAEVDAHLRRCPDCRAYQAEAAALTRELRVRPVTATPDLVEAVLARAERPDRVRPVLRGALAVVAVLQIMLALSQVLGITPAHGHLGHEGMSAHLFNESTAWNLALGVGMLWAAWRDRTAGGVLPVLGAFVAVLAGFSVHDLVVGAATASRVVSHVLLVAGLGLLVAVHRRSGRGDGGSSPARSRDGGGERSGSGEPPEPGADEQPHLRPTAQHKAA